MKVCGKSCGCKMELECQFSNEQTMKNEKRYRSEQFSITNVFLSIFGILFLILLTVVGAFDPAYNWIDKWFNDLMHQVYTLLFVCSVVSVWFWKWKFKEWRN